MKRVGAIAALLVGLATWAASTTGNLLWPLPSSRVITGGFADTRPDHFHGGVDLRAREPQPVVAPTDGWVERISVNPSGYGRALYFRLDDGRTAVFGHLSRFAGPIEEAMRDSQIVGGTSRIDVSYHESRIELQFKRGTTIAYTGETGSGPPHLHFEIREGAVQTDPLANYSPRDQAKPIIVGLWWTTLSEYSPTTAGFRLTPPQSGNKWLTHQRHGIRADEPVAFYIQTYDPGPWGRNAVPVTIRLRANGELLHEEYPGRIDLAEPKRFYEDIVWAERKRNSKDVRRLFAPPPPERYAFTPLSSEGWISDLHDGTVTIEVVDRAGNTTVAEVTVTCGPFRSTGQIAPPRELRSGAFTLSNSDPSLAWASLESNTESEIVIGPADVGFARPCTLTYRYAPGTRDGLFFYERTGVSHLRPLWRLAALDNSETMRCTLLRSGIYGVGYDIVPPSVQISLLHGRIRVRIVDEVSWVDDSSIRCTVDGSIAIVDFEYEDRGGYVWTQTPLRSGRHEVQVTAGDRAGNVETWRSIISIP